MILVSVIIPVHDAAPFLHRCMDSVVAQTHRDLDIICVDDGSTDGSAVILADYAKRDSRIRVITQSNAGPGRARNVALVVARGDYVCFVDADDYLSENFIAALLAPEADLAIGRVREEEESGTELNAAHSAAFFADVRRNRMCFTGWFCCALYRRSMLLSRGIRFGERSRIGEDRLFALASAVFAERVVAVPEATYHYVRHPGSLTNGNRFATDDFRDGLISSSLGAIGFLNACGCADSDYAVAADRFLADAVGSWPVSGAAAPLSANGLRSLAERTRVSTWFDLDGILELARAVERDDGTAVALRRTLIGKAAMTKIREAMGK